MPNQTSNSSKVLIGRWRTEGDVLGDDGQTPIARMHGYDDYEWLGRAFVLHRIDVEVGRERVQGLEIIGPYLPDVDAFATRAYDHEGSEQTSTAVVNNDGVWTFRADGAEAKLTISPDGKTARAAWVRTTDGGTTWRPSMRLTLSRA